MKYIFTSFCCVISLLFFNSCTTSIYKEAYPTLIDGSYDSEFPYKKCSEQLEQISEAIKYVNCITYYKIILFNSNLKLTRDSLNEATIKKYGIESNSIESTASGTATIINYDLNRISLITCAHIIDFDDTLYSYASDSMGYFTPYLNSISIKEKESIYVPDLPESGELEIVAMDTDADLALLGQKLNFVPQNPVPTLKYPFGKAKELEWGTFVYMFGYPLGYKTLTKALVSNPNRDKYGSFFLDAMFNRGFSGGVVFAIRDGVPNFELVGMVKLMYADYEYTIKPPMDFNYNKYNPLIPYSGELFVDKKANIKYGVTKAIPAERIFEFLYLNRVAIAKKGYSVDRVLEPYF